MAAIDPRERADATAADANEAFARACESIPALHRAVLAFDGAWLAGLGETSVAHERMLRAAVGCLGPTGGLVEALIVVGDELVALQRGRRAPRLVLAVACGREPNLALVRVTTREALAAIEAAIEAATDRRELAS